MAPAPGSSRPKAKTPAERAAEAAGVQQRLKAEAAERRQAAAKKPPAARKGGSVSAQGRRRTP